MGPAVSIRLLSAAFSRLPGRQPSACVVEGGVAAGAALLRVEERGGSAGGKPWARRRERAWRLVYSEGAIGAVAATWPCPNRTRRQNTSHRRGSLELDRHAALRLP